MARAGRSLTEPPGFAHSALSQSSIDSGSPKSIARRCSERRGVLPIAETTASRSRVWQTSPIVGCSHVTTEHAISKYLARENHAIESLVLHQERNDATAGFECQGVRTWM